MILSAGSMEARLAPETGGALASLSLDGRPILRAAAPGATGPLDMASFPLVPYANRIAQGRFAWDGQEYRLRCNFGTHPHSLHGVGWHRAWDVADQSPTGAVLALAHAGDDDWPFPFRARQEFLLARDGIAITLTMTNTDDVPRPFGPGFHPYFAIRPESRLSFAAAKVLLADETMLPIGEAGAGHFGDWRAGAPIGGDTLIDNAYAGWTGTAQIDHGDGLVVVLEASDADWLHLYRPPGEGFACLEPVSHGPDAINREGIPALEPGDSASVTMRITVQRTC